MRMESCTSCKENTGSKRCIMAGAVVRRPLIAETRLRYQVSAYENCAGQRGTVKGFLSQYFRFSCQYRSTNTLPSIFPCHYHSISALDSNFPLSVTFRQISPCQCHSTNTLHSLFFCQYHWPTLYTLFSPVSTIQPTFHSLFSSLSIIPPIL